MCWEHGDVSLVCVVKFRISYHISINFRKKTRQYIINSIKWKITCHKTFL